MTSEGTAESGFSHEKKSLASIVVACSLRHVNLDARQKQIEDEFKEKYGLPIIYFTQFMGLSFGLKSEELGLDKHFVDPLPFLKRIEAKFFQKVLSSFSFLHTIQSCKEKFIVKK